MNPRLMIAAAAIAALASPGASGAPSQLAGSLPSSRDLPPYAPEIDRAKFSKHVTNKYFPLTPGTTFIYEGRRDDAPRRIEVTVTAETKMIMGVPCIVVRDVVTTNTELVEKTVDWYAQDKNGNVWYFGEDTAEYKNGKVTSTAGTWMAGVDGALPGMIMQASPRIGDGYRQEFRPGIAEDYAKVVQLDATAQTPAGNYDRVVITEDIDLLDPAKLEHKSYAPGIGFVGSSGMVDGHKEEVKLAAILKAD